MKGGNSNPLHLSSLLLLRHCIGKQSYPARKISEKCIFPIFAPIYSYEKLSINHFEYNKIHSDISFSTPFIKYLYY